MGTIRTFRDNDVLKPKLDSLERGELSRLVRKLLYDYFFEDKQTIVSHHQVSIPNIEVGIEIDDTPLVEDFKLDMFD